MAGLNDLIAQAIGAPNRFNWPWFIELCVCGILALFFLFYFNRLFATLSSYGIRAYAWHHYRVWIDIQALQISLLGGRIFFKGVRYHGENETIFVHNGYVTWRYWLRNVRHADLTTERKLQGDKEDIASLDPGSESSSRTSTNLDEEHGTTRENNSSEARIAVFVSGVEWFIYNRTPLYDAIVRDDTNERNSAEAVTGSSTGVASSEALKVHLRSKLRRRPKSDETTSSEDIQSKQADSEKIDFFADHTSNPIKRSSTATATTQQESVESDISAVQSLLVRILPLHIDCSRVAISIGNEHTRAILVTTVEKARGHVDARGCGPSDLFRQLFEFDVEHPVVQMRPNPDFVGTQFSVAEHFITETDSSATKRRWWRWSLDLQRRKHNALHALRNLVPGLQSSVESLHRSKNHVNDRVTYIPFIDTEQDGGHWHGLSRYLDENESDDHQAWTNIDYARFSTILDCPSVHMSFFWDTPGRVRDDHVILSQAASLDNINGVEPPAYGLDLVVRGGNINYGPWADRLRAEIQSVFFPASYRSPTPATPLKPGDWRQSTNMIIRVDIEEEVTMRVPTRESSKDWRWRGKATAVRDAAATRKQRQKRHFRLRRGQKGLLGPDIRPFGWLAFSVSADSSVRYEMDLTAGHHGYRNTLNLDLKHTKATSSVNHADLWRCSNHKLQCDLSNPLTWNSQHTWRFNIQNEAMDMFLLRDHMFLLTDLIADFTAGQKGSYMTFVPFEYQIGLRFDNLKLFLNANDFNIIDNPCDLDTNAFLVLGMHKLEGNVDIPMRYFSSSQNSVHFRAHGDDLFLDLKTPVWNTLHSFAKDENMATLKKLGLSGSYNYNAGTSAGLTDSLFMDILGGSPVFHLEGFLIRYFMNVKENYFGEDLHFRTLEEYQSRLGPDNRFVDDEQRPNKNDNDLDVVLNVRAENSCALMPANIYERNESLRVDVMLVEADMRFTNYYMDLQVNSSPIEVSIEKELDRSGKVVKDRTACQLFITEVSVYGHRLFGAPPTEPTYVCNWDFGVGNIYGECSTQFLQVLIAAIQAFIFTFDDEENALPITRASVLDDVTFLRATVHGIRIWIVTDIAAFLVETGVSSVSFDDWAGQHFSKSLKASIPSITLAAIDPQKSTRRQDKLKQQVPTLACLETTIQIVNIDKKPAFEHQRQLQQSHVKFHDLRTCRATCLVRDPRPLNVPAKDMVWSEEPPAMPVPDLPHPCTKSVKSNRNKSRIAPFRRNRRPASFLSVDSNSAKKTHAVQLRTTSSYTTEYNEFHDISTGNGIASSRPRYDDSANKHSHSGRAIRSDASFSSAWIEPYFPLAEVQLDLRQMPTFDLTTDLLEPPSFGDGRAKQDYTDSDETVAHAAIFCSMPEGLRAFCSPRLFQAIVNLLQNITPGDPHSLLDQIQRSTITNIKSLTADKKVEKIDIGLYIPLAAVRLIDIDSHTTKPTDLLADEYEVTVTRIRLNSRIAPTISNQMHQQNDQQMLLLQSSIHDISISVVEKLRSGNRAVANLLISVNEIGFWLSLQEQLRTNLQISSVRVSTGGSTVDRLSMLAERARVMITNIIDDFEKLDPGYAIRHLVYHLALLHTDTADPVFLSKPSYVLRSAVEHVRLADSWKILSQIRQRLLSRSAQELSDLVNHESCLFEHQPDRAKQQILESVDHWETWDRSQEACGPILKAIFGKSDDKHDSSAKVQDTEAGVYLGQVSIVLDPGPQQSEFMLRSGDLSLSQKPVHERSTARDVGDRGLRSKLMVQIWFAEATIDLNWSLIELARSLVKQINLSSAMEYTSRRRQSSAARPIPAIAKELDLMVVAGTDLATVKIRTINLNIYLAARNLKSSIVVHSQDNNITTSILLAAATAQLKLASQYRKMFNWKLQSPTVYGQHQQRSLSNSATGRFAASCDRLRFNMKEDILSILEVVETVIKNEVTIIQEVVDSIEQQTAVIRRNSSSPSPKIEDIHVTFFLNNYRLQIKLLPSLLYNIAGAVARTSIVPLPMSKYAIHMDVKKNKHTLVEPNNKHKHSAASLEIPPISGRVVVGVSTQYVNINARTTLERITIEADAVQAFFEACYKPRIMQRLQDGKAIINRIQNSIKSLGKVSVQKDLKAPKAADSTRIVLYSGHAVLEGLDIHCSAPAIHGQEYRAELKFGLRETTLRIHNHRRAQQIPMEQPQFEVSLRQLFAALYHQSSRGRHNYGRMGMGLKLTGTTQKGGNGDQAQNYRLRSESMQLDLFAETAALVIDMATFLQNRITEMTTVEDRQKLRPLRRLTLANHDTQPAITKLEKTPTDSSTSTNVFDTTFSLDLNAILVRWIVNTNSAVGPGRVPEDLVFSIRQIDLRTQRESSARLTILDLQLQTVPKTQADPVVRTANSALLPEMIFNAAHFSTTKDRRFAFQAAGKALDLRLAADGILPLTTVQKSLARATAELRNAKGVQTTAERSDEVPVTSLLGNKRLASLLVDADFAGAVVNITPKASKEAETTSTAFSLFKGPKRSKAGRYGQAVQSDGAEQATLRAPGIAVKVEYLDTGNTDPTLSTEVKVAASSNTLAPSVVPLVLEVYSSVKEIMGENSDDEKKPDIKTPAQKYLTDAASAETDPAAILGRVKLNAGLWVQKQEFSLTCQPIARVAATARFDDIFVTINTVQDVEHERFFSITTAFNKLQASVQHVYSRESTASFEVESIVMSLMNSKHVNEKNGISAILNISPMRASLNAKQMQDFLLFREIWYPAELRYQSKPPAAATTAAESQVYAMQRYHELAATAALPWHAIISIQDLKLEVDFGQSLGKSSFMVSKLWASSKKSSDWEQNLCIGFERMGIDSSGRMSGFIELKELRVRTSIRWPASKNSTVRAPLVQASIGFGHLRLKTAFDYQPFAVADVSSFEFLMYNVRPTKHGDSDRLVGILDGGKVQVFCISTAAAQALSIVQAFERLVQEKRDAFEDLLRELDKFLRRKSIFPTTTPSASVELERPVVPVKRESHCLHTDVVVTLKEIDLGAFPNTFFDTQIIKVEAVDVQARFAVAMVDNKLRSGLGMTLGQVRVALSAVSRANTKALGEVEIGEVIGRATTSKGGTILKVPRLVASMQTWQEPHSNLVEYIFTSTFQGKVDVGWNFSRISFIKGMWETHSQALAHRLGKPLPPAAVKITAEPQGSGSKETGQEKITAVVNVPQSTKYRYVALEPPIIDTPQLRDMGEATPPLEWIGLHRDKLPNVTHSIVIVTLLEVAKEVEDAYTSILGTG